MKKYLTMPLALLGTLLLSAPLFAGEGTTVDFGSLDLNKDGSLSVEEAASSPELSSNWSTIDSDENGVIDQAEFSAFESMQEGGSSDQPTDQ